MKARKGVGSVGVAIAMVATLSLITLTGCGGEDQSSADDLPGGTDHLTGTPDGGFDTVDDVRVSVDVVETVGGDIKAEDVDAWRPGEDIEQDSGKQDATCGTCTGGKICSDGECRCPATQEDCNGTCTTLGTNEDCSSCGDVCPTGGSCQAGTCGCPSGQVNCDDVCTELGTDDNCSDCGDECVGTKTCTDKECVAEVDPECLPSVPCVTDDDCVSGNRCNQAITPPACQKLYCGAFGTACSEDYFCLSMLCDDEACNHDCGGLECGPDPVYGESCGTCQEGASCKSNHCVCDPKDHFECVAGNVTWIDSCGDVGAVKEGCPLACLGGECVDCEAVGKVNCSGTCTLMGTTLNCSGCGDTCPTGGFCNEGTCECPIGEADCFGACTLMGTLTNCTGCGDVCTGGKECNEGSCQCPVGETDCSGTCTVLGTDSNCSECGEVCPIGGSCNSGSCECPVGENDCFGTCSVLGTRDNCSGCGDVCLSNQICDEGNCNDVVVEIEGDNFWQGCNEEIGEDCYSWEYPYHEVTVPAFEIDKYEVTVDAYEAFVEALGDSATTYCNGNSCEPTCGTWASEISNWGKPGRQKHPINCIKWDQAHAYCEWAGKRLCSESEWEKAARGTDGRIYPWGNEVATCDYAVMYVHSIGGLGCGSGYTMEVGSKPAGMSPEGVLDMSGNVLEWVEDDWHSDYSDAPEDGFAWVDEPRASRRVARGGGFADMPEDLRAAARAGFFGPEGYNTAYIGIRCCRDAD